MSEPTDPVLPVTTDQPMIVWEIEMCGRLADVAGSIVHLPLPVDQIGLDDLRHALITAFPDLAEDMASGKVRACVDEVILTDDAMLSVGQIIAFFPPVSGG